MRSAFYYIAYILLVIGYQRINVEVNVFVSYYYLKCKILGPIRGFVIL